MLQSILVTGCAGDIGFSIGRILKKYNVAGKIFGCDIHGDHPGASLFDQCFTIPRADSSTYLESLEAIVKDHGISIVIPTAEAELRLFTKKNQLDTIASAMLITASWQAMSIGFDKLKTAEFLKENNLDFPWTLATHDSSPLRTPCIIKSRFGAGSRDVHLIKNQEEVSLYKNRSKNDIWQEYLGPDDEEYTCGIFSAQTGEIRTIAFKRELQGGFTGKGEVVDNKEIETLLVQIAQRMRLRGAINAQLRLTSRGPVIFEINPRFSSTVVFRDLLGFQDVLWSIQDIRNEKLTDYHPPKAGTKFYRVSQEVIIP